MMPEAHKSQLCNKGKECNIEIECKSDISDLVRNAMNMESMVKDWCNHTIVFGKH